jgi:V/A-type H+/Na+-transporting ATPase subunit E
MEDLKSHLRLLHETEIHEIIEDAERQSSQIIKEASERADEIKMQKKKDILQKMQEEETSILSLAKIEQRKKIAKAKSQLSEDLFSESMKRLRKLKNENEPKYWMHLERLVVEAITKLSGTQFEVLINESDKKYIKENIRKLEKKASGIKKTPVRLSIAEEILRASGGAVVRTKDGKEIFNDTWEARSGKVKQEMTGRILELLFKGA